MTRHSKLEPIKYKIGTLFRHIDTEEIFKLNRIKFDTYILTAPNGIEKGESLFTLEYDYELVQEGEYLLYGKKEN